jgi:hypothetical protein
VETKPITTTKENTDMNTDKTAVNPAKPMAKQGTGEGDAPRESIKLTSGRTVRHERMSNGAQHAFIAESDTGEMTESEWNEYCTLIAVKAAERNAPRGFPSSMGIGLVDGALVDQNGFYVTPAQTIAIIKHYKAQAERLAEALRAIRDLPASTTRYDGFKGAAKLQDMAREALAQWEAGQPADV